MPTISTLTVDVQSRTSKFSSGLKLAIGGLATLAAGAAFAFKQFEDSEKVLNQTEAVLRSTGGAANVSAEQVGNLADAISRKTGIDDEAIQSGENLLLTFTNIRNEVGKGNDIFNQATSVITDMSVALGQDFKSSAIQVGKALQDPILGMTALRRVGVSFTEAQTEMVGKWVEQGKVLKAQKFILAELTKEFGGSAEAQKTASQTMATALGNLAETVGGVLAPAITFLADKLLAVVTFLQENAGPAFERLKAGIVGAWEAVKPFAEAIGGVLLPLFEAAWSQIKNKLLPALEKFKPLFVVIGGAVVLFASVVLAQFAIVLAIISEAIKWIGKIIDAFMAVVDWVRENLAEPILGAIQKIIEVIGDIIGWIKDRFLGAWQAVKGPVLAIIHAFIAAIQTLIGWIKDAIGFVAQLGQGVSQALAEAGAAQGVFDNITPPRPKISPNIAGGGGPDVTLHLHGDLARLVESVDQELAGKRRRNVALAHHGR